MHELSIAHSIVEVTEQAAKNAGAAQVKTVYLRLGVLAGVVKSSLLFGWELATENTLLAGATLEIDLHEGARGTRRLVVAGLTRAERQQFSAARPIGVRCPDAQPHLPRIVAHHRRDARGWPCMDAMRQANHMGQMRAFTRAAVADRPFAGQRHRKNRCTCINPPIGRNLAQNRASIGT